MKRVLKIVAWVLGGLVVLVLAAVVIVPLVIDPNDFRDEIESAAREYTGRDLRIEGDLNLSVFPWIGLQTGALSLSNPEGFDDGPMVSIGEADVRVRLLPLLGRRLEVDTVSLQSPSVHLIRARDGSTNWQDLGGTAAGAGEQRGADAGDGTSPAAAFGALAVQGVRIDNGELVWDDRAAGQRYRVGALNVSTGEIAGDKPVKLDVSFDMQVPQLPEPVSTSLSGTVAADPAANRVQLSDIVLTLASRYGEQPLEARLAVPEASLDGESSRVAASNVDVTMKHGEANASVRVPQLEFQGEENVLTLAGLAVQGATQGMGGSAQLASLRYDVTAGQLGASELSASLEAGGLSGEVTAPAIDADLQAQTLSVPELRANGLGVNAVASLQGTSIIDRPAFSGTLEVAEFNPRPVLQQLDVSLDTADPEALGRASASAAFRAGADQAEFRDITVGLDDTTVTGSAGITGFARPAYRFDLRLDAIDVDRYLPPEGTGGNAAGKDAPASPAEALALPVAALQGLDVEGRFTAGSITVSGITLSNVEIGVGAAEGNVRVDPVAANALEGTLQGSVVLSAGGESPSFSIEQDVENMQLGPLLTAAGVTDRFSGRGSLNVSLATRGTAATEMLQQLDGDAGFHLFDGAIRGFNLRKIVLEGKRLVAQLQGEEFTSEGDPEDETRFTELQGTVSISDGVATSNDLSLKSPLFRVTGEGRADLAAENIDYLLNVTIVASAEGQGGEALADLEGVTVPVRIQGPFASPQYRLDVAGLARSRVRQEVEEQKQELRQKLGDKLQEKLKGRLKLPLGD